ncbi:PmoA family protein [candidate division KSB1 bacterium]|nr:PmoA family protein [candidate division KSB1 bacterium]MBL7094604.1 PmoA family protein [candidate division KSB1 bacterium]
MKKSILVVAILSFVLMISFCGSGTKVTFVEKDNQIEVLMDGKLFTSYLFKPELTKPILFPVLTPSGIKVNRSFPFEKVEGESEDHPHHTGIFFTYDEVNQDGFWNNTTTPPQIKHVEVTKMETGKGNGTLSTVMHWVGKSGKTLLEENRTIVFSAAEGCYIIDFDMTLTAKDTAVVFHDTKEGMFSIRVARWLKEKNKGGTAMYLSSNGDELEKNVWGKRAEWVRLEGEKDGNAVGIAIHNHPSSNNYPTFWHARGYGLFAVNPLGQYAFESRKKVENPQKYELTLQQGESATFKFRMIIYEGSKTKADCDNDFETYKNL